MPADVASYKEMDQGPGGSWWTTDPVVPVTPELEQTFLAGVRHRLGRGRCAVAGRRAAI